MSSHQKYFNQLREKWTRNFNKTFGGGDNNKRQVGCNISKHTFLPDKTKDISMLAKDINHNYLYEKLIEKEVLQPHHAMEYCPYELAAEQMKDLMADSANSDKNANLL